MKRYSKSGKRWRSRRRLFTGLSCVLALSVMLAAAWKLDLIGWKAANSHLWTVSEAESAAVYSTPPESRSKIQDENTTGTPLPAGHGMDTTLFHVAVGLLVITAAVLMISKKTLSTIY